MCAILSGHLKMTNYLTIGKNISCWLFKQLFQLNVIKHAGFGPRSIFAESQFAIYTSQKFSGLDYYNDWPKKHSVYNILVRLCTMPQPIYAAKV